MSPEYAPIGPENAAPDPPGRATLIRLHDLRRGAATLALAAAEAAAKIIPG